MLININFSRGAKCDLSRDAEPTEPYHFHPVRRVCDCGNMTKPLMPAFVFMRRPDIEHGLLVAGILVVDLPKAAKKNERNMRLVEEIVQELTERAQSGVFGTN